MTPVFRPITPDDAYALFGVFVPTLMDLSVRLNAQAITGGSDPAVIQNLWERRRPHFEHIARTSDSAWLAEVEGEVVGYARSVRRDHTLQLTEFFVRPGSQSSGVGRELLARAFPHDGAAHRFVIATIDPRATARYLKAGVTPQFPLYFFSRAPEARAVATDLAILPAASTPETLSTLSAIDRAILGYTREVDHRWLLDQRQGYLYHRAGQVVGYGYTGSSSGPFALLDARDFPAVLAHAETDALAAGRASFGVEVPLINRAAVDYLLACRFEMDRFFEFFMADIPLGDYTRYLFTSPPFFS